MKISSKTEPCESPLTVSGKRTKGIINAYKH